MNIYVASSWRNTRQPDIVTLLRAAGHAVYDFREPKPGEHGFAWSEIDEDWVRWNTFEFRAALTHPVARYGFANDMDALRACDACVLVLPCGRSAHLELGYAVGAGKRTFILAETLDEPELMYAMTGGVFANMDELLRALETSSTATPAMTAAEYA